MKEIALTSGRYHEPSGVVTIVDDADYERLSQMRWRVFIAAGNNLYAANGRSRLMHRFLLDAPSGMQVDHINGDGLDNRRANIRLATVSQNLANQPSRFIWRKRPTTSKFKGVSLLEGRARPWRATISVESKQHSLGYYSDEEAAARAYDSAALRFFGQFARTNFPFEGGA